MKADVWVIQKPAMEKFLLLMCVLLALIVWIMVEAKNISSVLAFIFWFFSFSQLFFNIWLRPAEE